MGKTYKYQIMNELTAKQKKVYLKLMESGMDGVSPHKLALSLGFKESAYVFGELSALRKKGLIEKVEGTKGKNTRYKIV